MQHEALSRVVTCMRSRQLLTTVAGCIVVVAAFVVAAPVSAAPSRHVLPNTAPRWKAQAADLGPADSSAVVSARVYLTPRGGLDALARLATSLSTPGSADYAQFLTAAQYHERFAPTGGDVATVAAWLRSAGLTVTGTGAGNRYVSVSGSVAAARRAFGVNIDRFRRGSNTVQAPTGDVSVPDDVVGEVLAIDGLDTSPAIARPGGGTADADISRDQDAGPCSTYFGELRATVQADESTPMPKFHGAAQPYAVCGYTGAQVRPAYEGPVSLDGTGVTVAITGAYVSSTLLSDVGTYAIRHGDGVYRPGQFLQTQLGAFSDPGGDCDPDGWSEEQTLDVEAVHAMAPGATIHYYAAATCAPGDLLDTLARVADDGTAQLVSNSWDQYESQVSVATATAYEAVFLQGAVEGMSYLFASGDAGDLADQTGTAQVEYPSSDPYVTSVGGTATAIDHSGALSYAAGWGSIRYRLTDDGKRWDKLWYDGGSGGGTSGLFAKPAYQSGVVAGSQRGVPDMAMDADPQTGFLLGFTQNFYNGTYYGEVRVGGTSLATPLFAGLTALAVSRAGHGAGLLNPIVYAHADDFRDVSGPTPDGGTVNAFCDPDDLTLPCTYLVQTFNQDTSLKVGPGWDDVTGLGSPTSGWLTAIP